MGLIGVRVFPIYFLRGAYELYERHGRQEGHATQDWLQAEIETRKDDACN